MSYMAPISLAGEHPNRSRGVCLPHASPSPFVPMPTSKQSGATAAQASPAQRTSFCQRSEKPRAYSVWAETESGRKGETGDLIGDRDQLRDTTRGRRRCPPCIYSAPWPTEAIKASETHRVQNGPGIGLAGGQLARSRFCTIHGTCSPCRKSIMSRLG